MTDLPHACDYLVIGSGAAGAVVAARLSEDPDVSVVLLEAGPKDNSVLSRLPGLGFAIGALAIARQDRQRRLGDA